MENLELCKILIVDDELLIRQGIKHYLDWEQEGFLIVGEASNGQEALKLIEDHHPHIIITDIVMPIMDGEELTRMVKEKYPEIEVVILSSFGEFEYVRSTFQSGVVDYILKPKLDAAVLLKALKMAVSRIPTLNSVEKQLNVNQSIEDILNKITSGYEVNVDSVFITQTFKHSHYCLLGVDLRYRQLSAVPKEHFEEALQAKLNGLVYYSTAFDKNTHVFLFNGKQGIQNEVERIVQKYVDVNEGLGFVLSNEFADFLQIGHVYKNDLTKLLKYRFYIPDIVVLTENALPLLPDKRENFNLDWFTDEFKRRHFEGAFRYLQDHVSVLSKSYTSDIFDYKAFFGNIIFNITVLLSNMGYDIKELDEVKYSSFKFIDEAQNSDEVVQILDRFILEAKNCINSSSNQSENINMKMILKYVLEHYSEPLTLKDVANQFHFNSSYLSSFFSTHNNEGFNEYLNKIRIEEASRLLIKGAVPISEISSMVGYSDHSYFCKVFKKMKGVSPSQFKRKQNLR